MRPRFVLVASAYPFYVLPFPPDWSVSDKSSIRLFSLINTTPTTFDLTTRLIITICLALAMAMVIIDMTVANVALPTIAGEMGVPTYQSVWVITSYTVAEAISLALSSYVSNRLGRGRTLVFSITGFCIFSFGCGVAASFAALVGYRIAQALCGGLIVPTAQSLIVDLHTKKEYGRAISIVAAIGSLAPIAGPILGGWVTDTWSWRWVFLLNIPLAIGVLALIGRQLWPLSITRAGLPVDRCGIILLILFVSCLQIFLDLGEKLDWLASPQMALLLGAAILFFGLFIIWEMYEPFPVLDLRLLWTRTYGLCTGAFTSMFASFFAGLVITTLWLQEALGYTAIWAGIATAGAGGVGILVLPIVARLSALLDKRILISFGCLLSALSFALRADWTTSMDIWQVVAAHVVLGLSTPFYSVPLTAMILGSVEDDERTLASGLLYFTRILGAGVVTAILTTFWVNRSHTARAEIVERTDTSFFAPQLPDLNAEGQLALLESLIEKEAMTIGYTQVSIVCAFVFVVSAMIIWIVPKPTF